MLRYHNNHYTNHHRRTDTESESANDQTGAQEDLPEQNKSGIMSDDEQMDMGGDDYQQDFDPDELK